ncbi:MAG: DUF3050 domain-containing protein [Opitutae bacterium]|jgi:hypothetical protein|nr:DUF3050 domain-containing protein [Opitutae bacterium]MBT5910744.1 DUF3050 domain-containing protein [Opitutae bacterium]MBT7923655.1 DUF3050 domain-containing protein [Opitutae bacterium]
MLEDLLQATASKKEVLQNHPIYQSVDTPEALNIFMEHHVWAVWDFMSLAKSLQLEYTSCIIPWTPPRRADLARFINEIIRDEESDLDHNGRPASHFESYLLSMESVGASTTAIGNFIKELESGTHWEIALAKSTPPQSSTRFVSHTLKTVEKGNAIEIASSFAFGRELVLPRIFSLFLSGLNDSTKDKSRWSPLKHYLERHIELDGHEHGEAAETLIIETVGKSMDGWRTAKNAAIAALDERVRLWDSIHESIERSRT